MFTPPPSPRPTRAASFSQSSEATPSTSSTNEGLLCPPSRHPSPQPPVSAKPKTKEKEQRDVSAEQEALKRRTGRRFRNAVILVPALLMIITTTVRLITQGTPLSSLPFSEAFRFLESWSPSQLLSASSGPCPMVASHQSSDPPSVPPSPTDGHHRKHKHAHGHGHGHGKRSPTPANDGAPASSSSSLSRSSGANSVPLPTVPSTPPTLPTPFPRSFDGQLSQNFSTVSCYNFFVNMTTSTGFRSCRSIAMLIQTSDTFLEAQSNVTLLNDLVWGTCNTAISQDQCTTNMQSFATELKDKCAQELKEHHATATDTLLALDAYSVMRSAGCLTDPTTNSYCYVNAARDTNPANLYYYSIPLGLKIPSSADPQCTACLKSLMTLYGNAVKAAVKAGPDSLKGLRATYEKAAELTQGKCGAGYASLGLAGAGVKIGVDVVSLLVGIAVVWSSVPGIW